MQIKMWNGIDSLTPIHQISQNRKYNFFTANSSVIKDKTLLSLLNCNSCSIVGGKAVNILAQTIKRNSKDFIKQWRRHSYLYVSRIENILIPKYSDIDLVYTGENTITTLDLKEAFIKVLGEPKLGSMKIREGYKDLVVNINNVIEFSKGDIIFLKDNCFLANYLSTVDLHISQVAVVANPLDSKKVLIIASDDAIKNLLSGKITKTSHKLSRVQRKTTASRIKKYEDRLQLIK